MSSARLRTRLRTWAHLSLNEKVELFLVAGLALAAEVAVKLFALPRLTRWLGIALVDGHSSTTTGSSSGRIAALSRRAIETRARAVDRVYRVWPRKNSCLRRALVLGFRIRAANPVLQVGVAQDNGSIRAHAWIEVEGAVIGESSGDYAPLRPPKQGSHS